MQRVSPGTAVTERIMAHVETDEEGCWLWQGWLDPNGYGRITVDGKTTGVHRVSYEAFVGPIPDGLTIHHTCYKPACANPEHLRPLSLSENSQLIRSSFKTHCARGHEFTKENTRVNPKSHRKCRACDRINTAAYHRRRMEAGACPPACDGLHPGRHCRQLHCPDCGLYSAASWSWETDGPDGYFSTWGGICSTHGAWSDQT